MARRVAPVSSAQQALFEPCSELQCHPHRALCGAPPEAPSIYAELPHNPWFASGPERLVCGNEAGRTSRVSARMICHEVTHRRPPPFNIEKPLPFAGPEKITAEASPCSRIRCRECDERGKAMASGTQPCIQGIGLPTEACRYIQRLICEGGMLK
jgi:hypothetical protein